MMSGRSESSDGSGREKNGEPAVDVAPPAVDYGGLGEVVKGGEEPPATEDTPIPPSRDRQRFACDQCDKSYLAKRTLYTHKVERHEGKLFTCEICDAQKRSPSTFTRKTSLKRHHQNMHEGPYACYECPEVYEDKLKLEEHKLAEHSDSSLKLKKRAQVRRRHAEPPAEGGTPMEPSKGRPRFACDQCDKSYLSKRALYTHKVDKHKGKIFTCEICAAQKRSTSTFSRKTSLKRHHQNMHEGPYACSECPGVYENRFELDDHKLVEHSDSSANLKRRALAKRKHADPLTGEEFPSKRKLQEHLDSKEFRAPSEDYEPDTTKCPYCAATMESRTDFLQHITTAHPAQIGLEQADEPRLDQIEARVADYVKAKTNREHVTEDDMEELLPELIEAAPGDFFHEAAAPRTVSRQDGRLVERFLDFRLNALGLAVAGLGLPLSLLHAVLLAQLRKLNKKALRRSKARIQFVLEAGSTLSSPIASPFYRYKEGSEKDLVETFLAYVGSVFTSKQGLFLDEELRFTIVIVGGKEGEPILFGGSNFRNQKSNVTDHSFLLRKKDFCCFVPHTTVWENDCALSALHLGLLQKENPGNFDKMEEFCQLALSPKLQDGVRYRAEMIERFCPGIDWAKPQTTDTLNLLQTYLNMLNFQLVVFEGVNIAKPIFKGWPQRSLERQICFIYLRGDPVGHMCLVTNPERLFSAKFCEGCLRIFKKNSKHNFDICDGYIKRCSLCRTSDCLRRRKELRWGEEESEGGGRICEDCDGCFPSEICYTMHKTGRPASEDSRNQKLPVCDFFRHCPTCGFRAQREEDGSMKGHKCLQATCRRCKETYSTADGNPHYCSIPKAGLGELGLSRAQAQRLGVLERPGIGEGERPDLRPLPSLETLGERYVDVVGHTGLVFFDLETRERPDGELIPFACVAYFMCSKCCFKDFDQPSLWLTEYPCCGKRIRRYVGLQEIIDFVATLFFRMNHLKKVHAFAFNGSGFDFVFILNILVCNSRTPQVKMKGRRILHLKMGKVILKDLLAYIPTNLASLPKTFKFEDKVLKGFFPHKLSNVVDNGFESEVWPHEKFYEPAKLRSEAERAELRAFLAAKAGQKFKFMEECLLYCSDDVLILALAVLALERTTLSETAFHISFVHSSTFTVAGLASIYYRHLFMRPKSIGLFPVHGYANLTNVQSLAAEIYFRWLNEGRRREGKEEIRYSKSSIYGEHKMANLRVDGVTSTEMWEYDSCFHHASPCCYQGRMREVHPLYKIPFHQVHFMDVARKLRIRQANPKKVLHIVKHCEVVNMMEKDSKFGAFFHNQSSSSSVMRHVDVRDALFGGRVENFAKIVELSPSEIARGARIKHVDVVSEYPFVQFTKRFPLNLHPTVIHSVDLPRNGSDLNLQDARMFFGLFSVFIVPPRECMFPTVPFRAGGKTLYGLCASCMRAGEQKLCRHYADEERGWHTTLNSPDLEQALSDGFRVLRCYEVLDWGADHTTTDLFADNIRHLIKQKTQSKDGAEHIGADERAAMVEAWARIGVRLDPDGWRGNAAIYQFYKILLNSLWGKLAQRQVKKHTHILKTWEELEGLLENEKVELTAVQSTPSDVVVCQTEDVGGHSSEDPSFYNPFIATLVASYARLHISSYMGGLGFGNPYYCDTDSLIYKSDPGRTNDPEEDPHKVLGSLTSELPPGTFIKKLVILAPKSYAYDVYSESDPYANHPLYTVVKMKGMSLRSPVKSALTTRILEKLALSTMTGADTGGFYQELNAPMAPSTTSLTIPQPRLTKSRSRFAISSNTSYAKLLSASFTKRLLRLPRVHPDTHLPPHQTSPHHPSHYPSLPFGYQCDYFGN